MSPKQTFLERNKKKSFLAALLLLWRERKALSVLLLLVLLASAVFVSPPWWSGGWKGVRSSAQARSPAGLLAALHAAKAVRGAGWNFFRRLSLPAPVTADSVAFVQGVVMGRGAAASANKTVAAIVNPADAKSQGRAAVPLAEGELEGAIKNIVGRGFADGLMGAAVAQGFLRGAGSPSAHPQDLTQALLQYAPSVDTPTGRIAGGARGRLSAMASRAVDARARQGARKAGTLTGGTQAYTQLAEGYSRDRMAVQYCKPPTCPEEYAAANVGAIYDGNLITGALLTTGDPGANAAGLLASSVNVPQDSALSAADDPAHMAQCVSALRTCESHKDVLMQQQGALQDQLNGYFSQMAGACGDPCNCGPCNNLKRKIQALCKGPLQTTLAQISAPCALPSYCAALGISDPGSMQGGAGQSLCRVDMGKCGCGGNVFCSLMCIF